MIERFKLMRKELGLTLDDVASALGISIGSVAAWEVRKKIPGDRIYQLAEVFGVSADWLRTGVGEMFEEKQKNVKELTDEELALEVARRIFERLPPEGKKLALDFAHELLEKETRVRRETKGAIVESKSQTNNGTIGGDMIQN